MAAPRNWRPGSFTKNFSWGKTGSGLGHLHEAILVAFKNTPVPVERDVARRRLTSKGINDFIPANFFVLNKVSGRNFLVPDELVLTALAYPHDRDFDRLAAFALNLSMVGIWQGAQPYQRYPAEWAKHFIVSRVFENGLWRAERINANEIRDFLKTNADYNGVWAEKTATNLNYIYELAGLNSLRSGLAEKWWTSAIFLALDRISVDRSWSKPWPSIDIALRAHQEEHVFELTAVPSDTGLIAAREVTEIYFDLGGPERIVPGSTRTSLYTNTFLRPNFLEKAALPVQRIYALSARQVRDRVLVAEIRSLYDDCCCICGIALPVGNGLTYCEVGHVKPVGSPFSGADHASNVIPFCPNHHRQFDRGSIYFEVDGNTATIVDRCLPSSVHGRTFRPVHKHPLDMNNLKWHASFFKQD